MAATVRAGSAVVTGGTTSTAAVTALPTLPTGTATGDRVYVIGTGTAALSLSANGALWTVLLASTSLGSGSAGASTGPRFVAIWWRDKDAGWSTMPTVQSASMTANSVAAGAVSVQHAAGESFDVPQVSTGSYTTGSTSLSVGSTQGIAAETWRTNALAIMADSFPSTTTTASGSITATGVTFGTKTNTVTSAGTTTGNDVALAVWTAPVTTGSGTAQAATHTATLGTARTAGVALIAQSVIVEPWVTEGFESVPAGSAASTSNTSATASGSVAAATLGLADPNPILTGARSLQWDDVGGTVTPYLEWTPGTTIQDFYAEVAIYLPSATPPNAVLALLSARTAAGGVAGQLGIDTAGKLVIRNASSVVIWTSTNPLPTQTWIRAQLYGLAAGSGAPVGQARAFYGANLNGATPDVDSGAIGTWTGVNPNAIRCGMPIAPTAAFQVITDSVVVRTDTWPSAPAIRWHADGLVDVAGAVDDVAISWGESVTDVAGAVESVTVELSGTAYTPSPADVAGAVESVTASVDYPRTVTDTAGTAEVVTVALGTGYTASPVDAAGAAETVAISQGEGIADVAGATDAVTTALTADRQATDAAAAAETVTEGRALGLADGAGAADTVTTVQGLARTAADVAGAADAVTASTGYPRTVTDAAGAADVVTAAQGIDRQAADPAGAADSVTVSLGFPRTAADVAGAVESVTTALAADRPVSDVAGASEQVSAAHGFVLTESAGATDTAAIVQSAQRSVVDLAGISDEVTVGFTGRLAVTATDTAGAVESVTVELGMDRAVADAAGAVDSVATAQHFARSPVDAAGAADSVAPVQDIRVTVADTAGAVDTVTADEVLPVAYALDVTDAAGAVEEFTARLVRAGRDIQIDWGRASTRQLDGRPAARTLNGTAGHRSLSGRASARGLTGILTVRGMAAEED